MIQHHFTSDESPIAYSPERGFGFVDGTEREQFASLQIPETNSGFLAKWWYGNEKMTEVTADARGCDWSASSEVLREDLNQRNIPLCFRQDLESEGTYQLKLTLYSEYGAQKVLVFAGRRRLVWMGDLAGKEKVTISANCDVSPIIPRGKSEPYSDPALSVAVLCTRGKVFVQTIEIAPMESKRIFIMADSTVTDQTGDFPYAPGSCYCGWGQMLGMFVDGDLCVSNHAHSGLTTESFRTEGHWDVMKPLLKKGDFCLLQFGHNDQKLSHLQAFGGYSERLEEYVRELRALNVTPVLVTPLARNSWNSDGTYNDLLEAYANAVIHLGEKLHVPVIDLHAYSMKWIKQVGLEKAKELFYPGDYTHTNDFGAYVMAEYVGRQFCNIFGKMLRQSELWKPYPPFSVLDAPRICKKIAPIGKKQPWEKLEEERPDELLTRVECLEVVIEMMKLFPINVYNDLFEDVLGHETYAGAVQCAVQNHLIPDPMVSEGKLYPNQPITLEEFFAILMPAYKSRRQLEEKTQVLPQYPTNYPETTSWAINAGFAPKDADWSEPLSRRQAAKICKNVRI